MNTEIQEKKKGKTGLSLITVLSTAGSIYGFMSTGVKIVTMLNEEGTGAFRSFILPGCLALFSLILAISYLKDTSGGRKNDSGEYGASDKRSVGSAVGRAIIKLCLVIIILGIISAGIFCALTYREYVQRPKVDVLEYLDLSEAISGYNGTATFDEEKVKNNLPYDLKELNGFTDSKNFDNDKDYSKEQDEWYRFYENFHFECECASSGLTNEDIITITPVYSGTDLLDIKMATHVVIQNVGKPVQYPISKFKELPTKYRNAAEAKTAKGDVIKAVSDRLRKEVAGNSNNSDYEAKCLLFKPKYNVDSECDALVVFATFTQDKGESYETQKYCAAYIYPFDSRVTTDIVSGDGNPDSDKEVQYITTNYFNDGEELLNEFILGRRFDSYTEYEMTIIE